MTMVCMCGAGPDSHSDTAPGVPGWSCSAGEAPVHAVWEKWRDPKSNDQTTETGEGGGECLKPTSLISTRETPLLVDWMNWQMYKNLSIHCVCCVPVVVQMMWKSQPANPAPAESTYGHDETYYTDLLKMKLDNAVWVEPQHCASKTPTVCLVGSVV